MGSIQFKKEPPDWDESVTPEFHEQGGNPFATTLNSTGENEQGTCEKSNSLAENKPEFAAWDLAIERNGDSVSLEEKYGKSIDFLVENPQFVIKQKLLEYQRNTSEAKSNKSPEKRKKERDAVHDVSQVTPNHVLQAAKGDKTCLMCNKTFTTQKSLHCHVMEMHGGKGSKSITKD